MPDLPSLYGPGVALVVVDIQNDFAHPDGSLFVRGGEAVVGVVNGHVTAARRAGSAGVYTQDWHPPSTPHFAPDGGAWPVHCVEGTWGAQLVGDLVVDGPVVRKGTTGADAYSGFSERDPTTGEERATGLDDILRAASCTAVVVVGLATDYCVMETALDARRGGLHATVLLEAVRAVDLRPGDGERAIEAMGGAGVRLVAPGPWAR